jgi:hypothetical protein
MRGGRWLRKGREAGETEDRNPQFGRKVETRFPQTAESRVEFKSWSSLAALLP